jgi:hypothetical protein
MDWTQVLTVFAVIATNLGTVIALYIQLDTKLEQYRKESFDILRAIQQEMKDFHGRLERQDAEFKAHLVYEHGERNKK